MLLSSRESASVTATLPTNNFIRTGFNPPNDAVRDTLGAAIAEKIPPVYGLDSTGELNNRWRPTPQPGLWFALGDFSFGRFFSRLVSPPRLFLRPRVRFYANICQSLQLARQILKELVKTRRVQTPLSATSEVPDM